MRALGLSLSEVVRVFEGDAQTVEQVLATHEAALEDGIRQLSQTVRRVACLRVNLCCGEMPAARELIGALKAAPEISVAFDLRWPWSGERFELSDIQPLNYIVGPLAGARPGSRSAWPNLCLMRHSWVWIGWRMGRGSSREPERRSSPEISA
jgi:hypothetical protein